ncbi:acyl-CoA carboxylase subunit epsilon [Cryobacterium arcticum]|uniref:Acyl-CoA carboxylase subunit epsilon n=1 Tax=Cryobacterium arcticum TaxID=670052 RepID=A0A317ZW63_9MICO|nr:acyl-CoA carboxylase subunit epsilon [Cryobacterium arcticum]PXA70107.1 hypothetical protein CTB96_08965 [Cryobacterium arcticum]
MTSPETQNSFDPADLTFVTSGVTDQEAAAVTAVLRALLRAESDTLHAATPHGAKTAWQDSQRPLRTALARGEGRWRGFGV